MTVEQVAALSGLAPSTLYSIEQGHTSGVTDLTVYKLADAFEWSRARAMICAGKVPEMSDVKLDEMMGFAQPTDRVRLAYHELKDLLGEDFYPSIASLVEVTLLTIVEEDDSTPPLRLIFEARKSSLFKEILGYKTKFPSKLLEKVWPMVNKITSVMDERCVVGRITDDLT